MFSPFIITESRYGQVPAGYFRWGADIRAAAASLQSAPLRRLMLDRLSETDGQPVHLRGGVFDGLLSNLSGWADYVQSGKVRTSYGDITSAGTPSLFAAKAIVTEIVAAIHGGCDVRVAGEFRDAA